MVKKPRLDLLLLQYSYSIDFDIAHRLVITEDDICISSRGYLDKINYMYVIRPTEDWKIYHVKNRNVGYLPQPNAKPSRYIKEIIKQAKALLEVV